MNLRKNLIAFDEGMSVYCNLEKDEEVILIPFSFSFYVTVRTIRALLHEYIEDLDRNECKEVLGIDFEQMTKRGLLDEERQPEARYGSPEQEVLEGAWL